MKIKMISAAALLLILVTAGCAGSANQWRQDATTADTSVVEPAEATDSTMEKAMDAKMDEKPLKGTWEDGNKY